MTPTPQQIQKLPKWAQDHIEDLERQRDISIRALNEFCDNQTPSPFYVEDLVCTGEGQGPTPKRCYIQAHSVTVVWAGVEMQIDANDYGGRKNEIGIRWSVRDGGRDVAVIPASFNQILVKTKENMR
jgi:hypothetical protein